MARPGPAPSAFSAFQDLKEPHGPEGDDGSRGMEEQREAGSNSLNRNSLDLELLEKPSLPW